MANEFKVKKGLIVDGTNTVLDIQGTQGQLFSVTDSFVNYTLTSVLVVKIKFRSFFKSLLSIQTERYSLRIYVLLS